MYLQEIRVKGKIELKPKNKSDLPLFLHCSGGYKSITTRYYNSHVRGLLLVHGVGHLAISGIPKK